MKKVVFLIQFLSFLSAIAFAPDNNNTCTISGTLIGDYSDVIYLNYGDVQDSTRVVNNRFSFRIPNLPDPVKSWLYLRRDEVSTLAPLYIENGIITVAANYYRSRTNKGQKANILTITKVTGSHAQDIADDYYAFCRENTGKADFHELLFTKLQTFMSANKRQPFSGEILAALSGETTLTKTELRQLHSLLDTTKQDKGNMELFNSRMASQE